jgi:hypothetical protein
VPVLPERVHDLGELAGRQMLQVAGEQPFDRGVRAGRALILELVLPVSVTPFKRC